MMQQILVGLGALINPLEQSPGFLAGSSNNSFSDGTSNKLWVWNNRKGIALVGSDIRNYSGGGASRPSSVPGYFQGDTETFSVPSAIDWAYCVCIGGGGGGNGAGAGDGGGGGGYAFAKIDLRPAHGTTINMRAGRGGHTHQSPNSEPSYIEINGSQLLRGNGGSSRSSSGPSPGGSGYADTNNPIIQYAHTATGGEGRDGGHGYPGGTGGGGGNNYDGGESTMPWCGGGAGGDGGGPGGGPGNSNVNFANSNLYDSLRGVHAVPSDTFQYSLVSNLPFFGDASSQSAFDGKQGRASGTSPSNTTAGFFGSGGGGSGAGSGFYGGPGAVIMWWS